MDLLIHLIIWIFRTLFGEQEPPARLGPRDRASGDEPSRGPYDYGDGRRSGPNKTLAELLEEARQQSEGGRPRQAAPQVQQRSVPQPKQIVQESPPAKKAKKRKAAEQPRVAKPSVAMAGAQAASEAHGVGIRQGPQTHRARQLAPLFTALRSGGGESRVLLAAQAVVIREVFGPPRCKRPFNSHRPGA